MKTRTPTPTAETTEASSPLSKRRKKGFTATIMRSPRTKKNDLNHNNHSKRTWNDEHEEHPDDEYDSSSDNASIGSLDSTLDSSLTQFHQHQCQAQWPWNKYLPERYAFPKKLHDHPRDNDEHDEEGSDPQQCEFCGPPPPTNAAYLKQYHIHLPSLLE